MDVGLKTSVIYLVEVIARLEMRALLNAKKPFPMSQLVKSLPFYIPEPLNRNPLRTRPQRIPRHCREYPQISILHTPPSL